MTSLNLIATPPRAKRPGVNSTLAAIVAVAALAQAPHAVADSPLARLGDPQAEQVVQAGAQRLLSILADRTLSPAPKNARFQPAINDLADVPKITSFVLGKYARTITPGQREQFATAFRAYAESAYRNRLEDYHGETLKVSGSVVRKPGDVIVSTVVSGGQLARPSAVAWRVLSAGGSWKVVDVQFKGVWLAITQQQDFVSTIDNAGGNVGVLIAQLESKSEQPAAVRR